MSNDKHTIEYTVNDEPQSTTEKELTPVQIMDKAGIDPTKNYLIQIEGNHQESYKDTPDKAIHMHEKMKFITNFIGPKPVSVAMGRNKFKEGLEAMGFTPEVKDEEKDGVKVQDKIMILFTISDGRFAGQQVKLGFQVPQDFEMTPPGGPHISPRLIPININSPDHSRAHESPFGPGWEYLSRPFTEQWARKRTVKRYMEYVAYLLNTL